MAVYGALAGVAWFFIHDYFLCPHGERTFYRHLLAYSIGGSLLIMTLWHPSAITTGGLIGLTYGKKLFILGLLREIDYRKQNYPKGFELLIENHDPKRREKALRDED